MYANEFNSLFLYCSFYYYVIPFFIICFTSFLSDMYIATHTFSVCSCLNLLKSAEMRGGELQMGDLSG